MVIRNILICFLILACVYAKSQPRRFKHLTSEDGISQSEVYTFLEDSRGFMWFGTVDGLNQYDGYTIKVYNTDKNNPNSLSNNTVRSLKEDKFGRIWIGTDDGLNLYDPKTELIYQIDVNSVEKKLSIWSLYIDDDHLLVGTSNGLSQFRNGRFSNSLTTHEGLFSNTVFSMDTQQNETLWIGSFGGVSRLKM